MNDVKESPLNLLQYPARKDTLLSAEEHVHTAARLSRVLWNALSNPELETWDERDREAMVELASILADHTSAAEAALYKEHLGQQNGADNE